MGLLDWLKGSGSNPLAGAGESAGSGISAGASSDFRMPVEDVFTITGRGTVVTGQIESGSISKGAAIVAERVDGSRLPFTVAGIEMYRETRDHAVAGENVGLLTKGRDARALSRGDVLLAR